MSPRPHIGLNTIWAGGGVKPGNIVIPAKMAGRQATSLGCIGTPCDEVREPVLAYDFVRFRARPLTL